MRRISLTLLLALVFPAFAAGAARDTKLALVAYSTPKDAYGQLISAFQKNCSALFRTAAMTTRLRSSAPRYRPSSWAATWSELRRPARARRQASSCR